MVTEQLPIGRKFKTYFGRTITSGDISLLTSLTWELTPLHADSAQMKSTQFGDVILGGPVTWACLLGLGGRASGLRQALMDAGFRSVAALGFESVRFPNPVKAGDTLYTEQEIIDARASSSNPNRFIIKIKVTGSNQKGETVCEGVRNVMWRKADGQSSQE